MPRPRLGIEKRARGGCENMRAVEHGRPEHPQPRNWDVHHAVEQQVQIACGCAADDEREIDAPSDDPASMEAPAQGQGRCCKCGGGHPDDYAKWYLFAALSQMTFLLFLNEMVAM